MGDMSLADFDAELVARGFDGYAPTDRYRYVQWGYRDVLRKAQWQWHELFATTTVSLSAGDFQVDLSTELDNFGSMAQVSIDISGGVKLTPLSTWDFLENFYPVDWTDAANRSTPYAYILYANKAWILPPTNEGRQVTFKYFKHAEQLDFNSPSNSTPNAPVDFDPAILSGALMYCHRRANQWDLALSEEAARDAIVQEFISDQEFDMLDKSERFMIPDPAWMGEIPSGD